MESELSDYKIARRLRATEEAFSLLGVGWEEGSPQRDSWELLLTILQKQILRWSLAYKAFIRDYN